MKRLWIIALLLVSGCRGHVNNDYIAQEIRTFYSGLLNGEDISVTCESRNYETVFFKEMNKNFHKKDYKEVDRYVKNHHLDIAYTYKDDKKISRYYHGNTEIDTDKYLNYYLTISASLDNLNEPHIEKSTLFIRTDPHAQLKTSISVENNQYDASIINTKTSKTYKEFKYCFMNQV